MAQVADSETTLGEVPATAGSRQSRRMTSAACGFGAFATVMFALFMVRLGIVANAVSPEFQIFMWVSVVAGVTVTLLLLAGTVLMWMWRSSGHVILIIASALGIAYAVSFTVYNHFHGPDTYGAGNIGVVILQVLLGAVPSLIALICAATAGANRATHR